MSLQIVPATPNAPLAITVQIKTVYGADKVYPACDKTRIFAELASTTTLTESTLRNIRALGYQINVSNYGAPSHLQIKL